LQTFWNEEKGFMTETTITDVKKGGRSGIGAAPLTVSVFNFDPTLGCDPLTFQPCSDRALSSLKVVGDAFTEMFPINKQLPSNQSPYFGFFLEDKLYGGQVRVPRTPFVSCRLSDLWLQVQYFASFNVAEQIFDALITWNKIGQLEVTRVSLKFFRQFDKGIKIGVYAKSSKTYRQMTAALKAWAENTLLSLAQRTPQDLVLPLVMNKTTGEPMPPRGALRSQVAVLGAHNAYNGVIPPSWANGGPGSGKLREEKSGVGAEHCHHDSPDEESQFGFWF
jgi:glucoamylase